MVYHPRIESRKLASFITTRSRNSELWFIHNPRLEEAILGYVAKFQERYEVKLYALSIEGNHMHNGSLFPKGNRASFMRDLNSCVAKAVKRYTPEYGGGRFWGRRYSGEFMPGADDVKDRFFYTVLQPVQDGLVQKISEYPGYNCFHDAIYGIERKYKVVNWGAYHDAKRYNSNVKIKDFIDIVSLKFERLPGYEDMPQAEYVKMMQEELEARRVEIVNDRISQGKSFLGREGLKRIKRGALPRNSKVSDPENHHRPRVLSICPKRRHKCLKWYFRIYFRYKEASELYRKGYLNTRFPFGTYRPYLFGAISPP